MFEATSGGVNDGAGFDLLPKPAFRPSKQASNSTKPPSKPGYPPPLYEFTRRLGGEICRQKHPIALVAVTDEPPTGEGQLDSVAGILIVTFSLLIPFLGIVVSAGVPLKRSCPDVPPAGR